MKKAAVLAVVLVLVSIGALTVGSTAAWLGEDVRLSGLLLVTTAIAAALLVAYFDWRGRLVRRFRSALDERACPGQPAQGG